MLTHGTLVGPIEFWTADCNARRIFPHGTRVVYCSVLNRLTVVAEPSFQMTFYLSNYQMVFRPLSPLGQLAVEAE